MFSSKLFVEYVCKCDFCQILEFSGCKFCKDSIGLFCYCVQKYDVSCLYYDFCLELDGILKSWVVFKGLCFDLVVKWFVVQVEDYLLDYVDFEGSIFQGYYGVGDVIVWD